MLSVESRRPVDQSAAGSFASTPIRPTSVAQPFERWGRLYSGSTGNQSREPPHSNGHRLRTRWVVAKAVPIETLQRSPHSYTT
ncbi:hypothetical protein BASA83_013611 [Batrachochytrium salamandrivorans]|nr:hypothetical protein BASA83_013611 [Batrachochytrium salamandrivorans]